MQIMGTKLLDVIRKDIEYKFKNLNEEYDALSSILPTVAEIDWSTGTVINTQLDVDTEDEKKETLTYLVDYINLMRITYNNILFTVYSQTEAWLMYEINVRGGGSEYKSFRKSVGGRKSKLEYAFRFLLSKSDYQMDEIEDKLFCTMNRLMRPERNSIAHELYRIVALEDLEQFFGENDHIMEKFIFCRNEFAKEINGLFLIAEMFFQLVDRILIQYSENC